MKVINLKDRIVNKHIEEVVASIGETIGYLHACVAQIEDTASSKVIQQGKDLIEELGLSFAFFKKLNYTEEVKEEVRTAIANTQALFTIAYVWVDENVEEVE